MIAVFTTLLLAGTTLTAATGPAQAANPGGHVVASWNMQAGPDRWAGACNLAGTHDLVALRTAGVGRTAVRGTLRAASTANTSQCGRPAAHEPGTFIAVHRGQLKIRTDIVLGLPARYLPQDEISTAVSSHFGPRQHIGDDMLRVNGVKLVVVNDGWWAYSPDKLRFLIDIYTRHDWNMAIHINTGSADEPAELVLSLLEEAAKTRPVAGRRISFGHGLGLPVLQTHVGGELVHER